MYVKLNPQTFAPDPASPTLAMTPRPIAPGWYVVADHSPEMAEYGDNIIAGPFVSEDEAEAERQRIDADNEAYTQQVADELAAWADSDE